MNLESNGILIELRPINNHDSLARIFTRDFGVMSGVMRAGAIRAKGKPLVGQIGMATWNARLDSQLGTFHWDAEKNLAAPLMSDSKKLMLMNSMFSLLGVLLPERERYDALYDETIGLLTTLAATTTPATDIYLGWEVNLLRELGYALDLHACAGCGATDNLTHLSPRTCRAVCEKCAAPYADRLYSLPLTLNTTRQLLDYVCGQQGITLPLGRRMIRTDN